MGKKQWIIMMALVAMAGLVVSACSIDVERNPDGSLSATVHMTEASIQNEIEAALNDPLIKELDVDLRAGYIFVSGVRKRIVGEETDLVTFRLDLGVSDGHLTATVSDFRVNGEPTEEEIVNIWNQRLAQRLENAGRRNPNSSLQSVRVTSEDITFVWRIETDRSRGG
ncbi:MAG: hypothetical protein GTO18_22100 [Anaerolineales bacterium]|nr:hypothetical protein [Anaerolineales bacterium]